MSHRDELLTRLRTETFDLLIIGGGIVGAGIARDAAMRGLKVALVERHDFASGTSSKTSKLIHGGLRYLEHGHVRLVFESLRERHILRTIAPQLVWPLSLMLPVYKGDARAGWKVAAGLTLYDLLAIQWNIPARHEFLGAGGRSHRMLSGRNTLRLEPKLNPAGLRAAAMYSDCQMEDARLCLANVLQAVSFGAVCCNYVKVVTLEQANGRVCGAVVEDARMASQFSVRARVVVNATGPWSDSVRRLSDRLAHKRLAPTKGIHLVVPRLSHQPFFFQARRDGRMMFLLPWRDYTLVGTTESTKFESLDRLHATTQDVEYLLEEANRLLPEAHLKATDIIGTFAGARPLLAFSGSSTRASREHQIEIDQYGLVSVMGGKYTTYRLMAQQTLDAIMKRTRVGAPACPAIPGAGRERCLTDQINLLEPAHAIVLNRWQEVTRRMPQEMVARLLATYGTGAFRILELVEFEPQLSQAVCPHHDVIQAELVYAMREELACTISDVLIRRTPIAYSPCQGLDMRTMLMDVFGRYGRLSEEALHEQWAEYLRFLADGLAAVRHQPLLSDPSALAPASSV